MLYYYMILQYSIVYKFLVLYSEREGERERERDRAGYVPNTNFVKSSLLQSCGNPVYFYFPGMIGC